MRVEKTWVCVGEMLLLRLNYITIVVEGSVTLFSAHARTHICKISPLATAKQKILDLQLKRLAHDSDAMLQKLDADIMPLVQ